jgi:cupin 2 domain-containing protein
MNHRTSLKAGPLVNLLYHLPHDKEQEQFENLLIRPGVKLERIVSNGQATPKGEWYDQAWDEWVMILQGEAELLLELGKNQEIRQEKRIMTVGDSILIPAHCRHRVEWTSNKGPTIWLALHLGEALEHI